MDEDSKTVLEQWQRINEMVSEAERLFLNASNTYLESQGKVPDIEPIRKALEAARSAYNKAQDLRTSYQKKFEEQLEKAPELREHLNQDVEFCNIAVRVALETLQKHCGTVQQVMGLVARAKNITVKSYIEDNVKWLAECPFCGEQKPEAYDIMKDDNFPSDDPRSYLGQQYHCRKCDRHYDYYQAGDIVVLTALGAEEPKKKPQ